MPFTDERELQEIAEVLASGYLTQGAKVRQFEQAVAQFVGTRHAFATSSGTTALHLALVGLGVTRGDEVLVADFTFPATGNVVVQQGAVPVLVDIDSQIFTMDPDDLRGKITPRSRAVIPVHLFGCSADMDSIRAIAAESDLPIIEDAACALGATYKGRHCGNLAAAACFSFHPRKVITTGEGGMIVTNDDQLAERIQLLRSHGGLREGNVYRYEAAGFNYRLSDVLGAIGVAQMQKITELLDRRRMLACKLKELLSDVEGISPPVDPPWGGHIYQSFVVMVDESLDRDRLTEDLRRLGTEATIGTYALHDQPFYQTEYGYVSGQLPNSHAAFTRAMTLPLYHQMTDDDLNAVSACLRKAIAAQRR